MLGCVLYEICALERPFDGSSFPEVVMKIINDPPKPLPKSFSSPFLGSLLSKMLDKDPEKRPHVNDLLLLHPIQEQVQRLVDLFPEEYSRENSLPEVFREKKPSVKKNIEIEDPMSSFPPIPLKKKSPSSLSAIINKAKTSPTNNETNSQSGNTTNSGPSRNTLKEQEERTKKVPFKQISINTNDENYTRNSGSTGQSFPEGKAEETEPKASSSKTTPLNVTSKQSPTFVSPSSLSENAFESFFLPGKSQKVWVGPRSPVSPHRCLFMMDFLKKMMGNEKFSRMQTIIEAHPRPIKLIEDPKFVNEFFGKNQNYVGFLEYILSDQAKETPEKAIQPHQTRIELKPHHSKSSSVHISEKKSEPKPGSLNARCSDQFASKEPSGQSPLAKGILLNKGEMKTKGSEEEKKEEAFVDFDSKFIGNLKNKSPQNYNAFRKIPPKNPQENNN